MTNIIPAGKKHFLSIPESDGGQTIYIPDANNGAIKTTIRKFIFSENLGDIYNFESESKRFAGDGKNRKAVESLVFTLSAGACCKIKNFAGILIDFPKTVLNAENVNVPNPTKHYDGKGNINAISLVGIATGYNQFGELMFARREITVDLKVEKVKYFFSLLDKNPGAVIFGECGKKPKSGDLRIVNNKRWNNTARQYEYKETEEKIKHDSWIEIPVDESTSLYIDSSHPEAISKYRELNNIVTTIERRLYTFVERNLIKALTGIQKVNANYNEQKKDWLAEFTFTAFRGKITKDEMMKLYKRINAGENIENLTIISEADLSDTGDFMKTTTSDNDDMDDDAPNQEAPEKENPNTQPESTPQKTETIDGRLLELREKAAELWGMAKDVGNTGLVTLARETAGIGADNGKVDWENVSVEKMQTFNSELERLINIELDKQAVNA